MNDPFDWHTFLEYLTACLDSALMRELQAAIEATGQSPRYTPPLDAAVLYAITRVCKPRQIVEVGTFRGMSTCFLRQGQLDAGLQDGSVITVDKRPDYKLGLLIPNHLQNGIRQVIGDIRDPPLTDTFSSCIDMYFHDSTHSLPFQQWEYSFFWPRLGSGGVLASHDVDKSAAFSQLLSSQYRHDVGGFSNASTLHTVWGRVGKMGFIQKT